MATKSKKPRARWDYQTERKLIDVWADILEEFDGVMMTRKKKEAIATTCLNVYVSEELNITVKYTEKEVSNKLDSIMKKGKSMYVNNQREGELAKNTRKRMLISTLKQQKSHGHTSRPSYSGSRIILHWVQVLWKNPVCCQVLVVWLGLNRMRMWPHLRALDPLAMLQWRVLVTVRKRRKRKRM